MFDNSSSSTPIMTTTTPPEEHQLLSSFQYVLLCLVALCCYYGALFVAAVAVGEPTSSLLIPVNLVKHVAVGLGTNIMQSINRRRNRLQVGVLYEEVPDDADFVGFNQPSTGVH